MYIIRYGLLVWSVRPRAHDNDGVGDLYTGLQESLHVPETLRLVIRQA
jgi:hypothetical protein